MKILRAAVFVILLVSCGKTSKPAINSDQLRNLIPGKYQGKYNAGLEEFDIKQDGTFSQKFSQDGVTVYEQSGSWSVKPLEDRYLINFAPFMDLEMAILKQGKPQQVAERTATFYDDEPRIWFFRDIDYFIVRQAADKAKADREK
jgi:hypothetical protein